MTRPRLQESALRLFPLAWPVFVGQIAVLAFSTVDTVMTARASALDLAALAIGGSIYISVFVGLMGVILAIGPIAGQLFGAGKHRESGHEAEQAVWLALGALGRSAAPCCSCPSPSSRWRRPSRRSPRRCAATCCGLACALPASLVFMAYRGFNVAVSRPKAVMVLQLGGLALKVPINALLVFGFALPTPFGTLAVPALGAQGCGIATAIVMWCQLLAAIVVVRRDPFYARFGLGYGLAPPNRKSLAALLRLGIPMGLSILIEVTGFTFMAFFISRIGATPVAGHQIAVNMVSLMFMLPLSIANASSVLVAQRIGAGDVDDAGRIGWAGLEIGVLIAAVLGSRRLPAARAADRPVHQRPGDHRRGPAAARLGGAVPRRRRGADDRRVRAARAPHRHRAAGGLRGRDLGDRPGRRLRRGVRARRRARLDARRPGLLVDGDARRGARRASASPASSAGRCAASAPRRGAQPAGSLTRKQRAAALARLAAHAAAVSLGDLLDQRQAEADAAGLLGVARQAEERLEDPLAHLCRHAGAAVADLDRGVAAARSPAAAASP